MKLYLTSIYRERDPENPSLLPVLKDFAATDRFRRHTLVDTPEKADAILITEAWRHHDGWRCRGVRSAKIVREYPQKVFVYCDADYPAYLLPGLYPSVTDRVIDRRNQASFCYLNRRYHQIEGDPLFTETVPDLLFSFAGTVRNHSCRREIMRLKAPLSDLYDSTHALRDGTDAEKKQAEDRYRHILARTRFVLCPRGKGASSFRLFETMAAGRVPVIISDAWVPPPGPDWNSFTLRIPEARVPDIPALLAEEEMRYEEMAALSREAYQNYFHSTAIFNYICDTLENLLKTRDETAIAARLHHLLALTFEVKEEIRRSANQGVRRILRRAR